jgi:hypothetical protein
MSDRWHHVSAIYHAARDRDLRDRPAFVAEACRGDVVLRQEVESLLAQDAGSDAILRTPPNPAVLTRLLKVVAMIRELTS